MIKLVIFDMDGLLIDSIAFWREAQKIALKGVGREITPEEMRTTAGMRVDEIVAKRYQEEPWEGPTQKDIEAAIVDYVIESIKEKGVLKPGAKQTLEAVKELGLPMCLASSSYMEVIEAAVDKLEIRDYFDKLFSAEHETHGKPHPGVYISTAAKADVPVELCLAFEDSPSGVLAAKAAKMKCIAVPSEQHHDHPFIQTADQVLDSLEDFDPKIIATL